MVDLIRVETADESGIINERYAYPDFSGFNKPVIHWSVTYGYETEPHMTIQFAGLPFYKDSPIEKAQLVTIPITDQDPIEMYVRSISYSLREGSVMTTLVLKTALIFFDQYLLKPLNIGSDKSAESVFTGLLSALELPTKFVSNNPQDWPSIADDIIIAGTETILDWVNAQLGERKKRKSKSGLNDKDPIFDWWFSIRNELRVEPIFTAATKTLSLDLNTIRPIYISLDIEIADKVEKRNVPHSVNTQEPGTSAEQRVINTNAEGTRATISTERVRVNTDNTVPQSAYQNFLVQTKSTSLQLKGIHWITEHEIVNLTNFPTANGEYVVETVTVSHEDTGAVTTLDLKQFELKMPRKENDQDDAVDNHRKPRQVEVNAAGTAARIIR